MSKYQSDNLFGEKLTDVCAGNHIIRVAFDAGVDAEFDYLVPDELWPVGIGQRVEVPFGRKNKKQTGFCVQAGIPPEKSFISVSKAKKLKVVLSVVDKEPLLDGHLFSLAQWISSYYVCPLGIVLSAMVPAAVKKGTGIKKEKLIYLAPDFEKLAEKIRGSKQKKIVALLKELGAFAAESAVELQGILAETSSTIAPVDKLAQQMIIKTIYKEVFKSLPVIPPGMMIQQQSVTLNDDQKNALEHIKQKLDSGKFSVTVLFGVTDSGKTEVYIRAIEEVLKRGKKAIVLLPEIALTAQTVQRFSSRFANIAVMHSGLNASQRNAQWQKIKNGQADVVIGARSAVFAPLQNLGLVVVDEEHEPSYKQDNAPRYNARDVAVKRAQLADAHCILGSATPSLETLHNCQAKKHFAIVRLPKRVMGSSFPEMRLVDLKTSPLTGKGLDLISKPLAEQLNIVLERKEQAILLLNRRGYSNFVFCPSCKYTLHCRNCDVTLTFHKMRIGDKGRFETILGKHISTGSAVCHYCGSQTLVPEKCPLCGASFIMIGFGSQRLEEEVKVKFPNAVVARVDSDSMAGEDYYRLLKDFSEGRINILAGTQMLAKGLHFPNVTLVGIISADTSLYLPDFRANERTFQLINQVAGRAGRCEKKGVVFVQTFLPDQPAIKFAMTGNFDGFIEEELKHRKTCHLPPFWRLASIVLMDQKFDMLEYAAKELRELIDSILHQNNLEAIVRGPMPATISRIQRFHRMQIIVQAQTPQILQRLFDCLRRHEIKTSTKIIIDIDPVHLL